MARQRVIVDSSIWIDHINNGDATLAELLRRRLVVMHPMIYAEVALGSIKQRKVVLGELQELPQAVAASHSEVIAMIEWLELHNKGIGYVDAHLLAATKLLDGGRLITRDKRLMAQAKRLDLAYNA
jgi:predicted nucleic acid-binding protein